MYIMQSQEVIFMDKKKKMIIAGIMGVIVGIGIFEFVTYNKTEDKKSEIETIKTYTTVDDISDVVFDYYLDMDFSTEDLVSISDESIFEDDMPFLEDGFYVSKLTKEEKGKEDLSAYEEAHDKYLKELHDIISDNLEYSIDSEKLSGPAVMIQTATVKSYEWWAYNMDFKAVYELILDAHYGVQEVSATVDDMSEAELAEYGINAYKAKVKTMQIMSNELERYENKDKTATIDLYYEKQTKDGGSVWRMTNAATLFNTLSGISYEKHDSEEIAARITSVLENSYNKYVVIDDYLSLDIPDTETENTEK